MIKISFCKKYNVDHFILTSMKFTMHNSIINIPDNLILRHERSGLKKIYFFFAKRIHYLEITSIFFALDGNLFNHVCSGFLRFLPVDFICISHWCNLFIIILWAPPPWPCCPGPFGPFLGIPLLSFGDRLINGF